MSKKEEKSLVPVKKNTLPVPVKKGELKTPFSIFSTITSFSESSRNFAAFLMKVFLR